VTWRIVVVKKPSVYNLTTDAHNSVSQTPEWLKVKYMVHSLSGGKNGL
jgi:hypothetical protein